MKLPNLHRDRFAFQCTVPEVSGLRWPAAAALVYLRQVVQLPEQVFLEGSECCINNDFRRNPLLQAIVDARKLSPTRVMSCGISLCGVVHVEAVEGKPAHDELQFSYAAFHPRNGVLFGWSNDLDEGINHRDVPPSFTVRLAADRFFEFDEAQLEQLKALAKASRPPRV
jgi:hypothetical protein